VKLRDYEGRIARVRWRIENRGGDSFQAGDLVEIGGNWRGKVNISDVEWAAGGRRRFVRHVDPDGLELLPVDCPDGDRLGVSFQERDGVEYIVVHNADGGMRWVPITGTTRQYLWMMGERPETVDVD